MDKGAGDSGICAYCGGRVPGVAPPSAPVFCCYGCRVLGAQQKEEVPIPGSRKRDSAPWFRIGLGACLAGQSMLFGLAANLGHPEGNIRVAIHGALAASAIAVFLLLGGPLVREACSCGARGRWSVEWLFIIGAVCALLASGYASITDSGAVYYDVVAVLLTVYTVGKALTATARARAIDEGQRIPGIFSSAVMLREGREIVVPIESLAPGDRIRVRMGGGIPVDGRIVVGTSHVHEGLLTGELMPVVRRVGDVVRAGGMAVDGSLEVEVEAGGGRRQLERVLGALRDAQADLSDTAAQRMTDGITRWFLPLVLISAAGTAAVWAVRGDWNGAAYHSLAVVLVACPCALGLATPLALWHGLSVLAAKGVSLRSAVTLERLARVQSVWFDKTGTLTRPDAVLADFVSSPDSIRREELLAWVANLERHSDHPIAAAFRDCRSVANSQVLRVSAIAGLGIEGVIQDEAGTRRVVRVGRLDWDGELRDLPAWSADLRMQTGDQLVCVWVDGLRCALGAVRFRAVEGWDATVELLHQLGCKVGILSGAAQESMAGFTAGGRVEVHGGLLPGDKADRIRAMQKLGCRILFVGDGVNDAVALQTADVGLAVGVGSPIARERAHGEISGFEPGLVAEAIRVARLVRRRIENGLWFAAFYNLAGMVLAASGRLHPAVAAFLMVGSSSMVTWQALRGAVYDCERTEPGREQLRWAMAACLALQIPILGWLGSLDWESWLSVSLILGSLAIWRVISFGAGRIGTMSWAMLGPGNLLMLLGWWVDAGFGPVMREGVCLCCQSHRYFEAGARIPWMWIGMIVGGLPGMWRNLPAFGSRGYRWPAAFLGTVGMVLGMNFGADLILHWAGPGHPEQFLFAWLGMTTGMFAGMGLGCGLVEAAQIAWRR